MIMMVYSQKPLPPNISAGSVRENLMMKLYEIFKLLWIQKRIYEEIRYIKFPQAEISIFATKQYKWF